MPVAGASADWHIRNEHHWLTLVEIPRALDRDSPVIRQGINRYCNKIAGSEYQLHSDTGDPDLDDALEKEIRDWANDEDQCDAQGQRTLQAMAWQALRSTIVDGDCFVIPEETNGFLKTYEAHRFRSPTQGVLDTLRGRKSTMGSHGVALNGWERPEWYFLTREDLGYSRSVNSRNLFPIKAYDGDGNKQVFHLFRPERFTGRRGISTLAPVMDLATYHDDTTFATCIANQLQTFFAIIHEFEQDKVGGAGVPSNQHGSQIKGEQSFQDLPNGTRALVEKVFGPMEIFASKGEKIHGFNPTIPGLQFSGFMLHLLGIIAANLGIPLAVLLLDARPELTGSYSGWRGAQTEAREGYKTQQKWLIDHFYKPVYNWRLRRLVAKPGRFQDAEKRLGKDFYRHEWKPPQWPQIDPTKDTACDVMRGETAQSSLTRIHADNGQDFEPEHQAWVNDRKFQIVTAIAAADEINKKFPNLDDKPTWRDCFPLVAGQAGASLVLASHQADDPVPEPATKPASTPSKA